MNRRAIFEQGELLARARELKREFFADDDVEQHVPGDETSGRKRKPEDDEPVAGPGDANEKEDEDDDEGDETLEAYHRDMHSTRSDWKAPGAVLPRAKARLRLTKKSTKIIQHRRAEPASPSKMLASLFTNFLERFPRGRAWSENQIAIGNGLQRM